MGLLDASELFDAVGGQKIERPDVDIIHRFREDDALAVPIELTDMDVWANYVNDDLYVLDKKIREFFRKTMHKRVEHGGMRTTVSVVFAWIFGRQVEPRDGYTCRILHTLLKYYCTSYTGQTTYGGKKVSRVYNFSKYAVSSKRAYSLRLRMEETEDGRNPFRRGRNYNADKRTHGRRSDRRDGTS